MFRKEINPFPVSDRVTFRNIDRTLTLIVRADAGSLVLGLKRVNDKLSGMTEETPDDDRMDAARMFAETLFGKEQGTQLCEFYGDSLSIIAACGMYFRERLSKKITKAQRK